MKSALLLPSLFLLVTIPATPGWVAAQPAPPTPPSQGSPPPDEPAEPSQAAPPAAEAPPDALATALGPRAGGMTLDEVGKLAAAAQPSVKVKEAELRAAAAKVDQALISYFPKLTLGASYTRSSNIENSFTVPGGPGISLTAPGRLGAGPCPGDAGKTCVLDAANQPVEGRVGDALTLEFPAFANAYSLVASLSLPVSDWVLRMSKGLSAAAHGERGKKLQVIAEQLQVAADAKILFLNWVRARGQVVVAKQAVDQSKAHVDEARRLFQVGFASKADVLRLEAQVASAEQLRSEAEAFEVMADQQLRLALGIPAARSVEIGVDVMSPAAVTLPVEPLATLQRRALERRLEIRALDETQHALKDAEDVTSAGYMPRLDIFANGSLANPNPRIFPQKQEWDFTWDAGVRLTWNVNETFITAPAVAEAKAHTSIVAEQRAQLRNALALEVASAYTEMTRAASNIEAANRGLAAAEESLKVRTQIFKNGKATSAELIDAETEVTRGRLRRLDAHVGLLVAKTRLEHATGRDVPALTLKEGGAPGAR
ncbi:MAG: TolC family protein [Polyangiaceae bacterium]|nr:TolC family protein [Polyangiaceae bacterium]